MGISFSEEKDQLVDTLEVTSEMITNINSNATINDIIFSFYPDISDNCKMIINDVKNNNKKCKIYYYGNTIYGVKYINNLIIDTPFELHRSNLLSMTFDYNFFISKKTI